MRYWREVRWLVIGPTLVALLLLIKWMMLGSGNQRPVTPKFLPASSPAKQAAQHRIWKTLGLSELHTFSQADGFKKTVIVSVDPMGSALVFEGTSYTLSTVSPAGTVEGRFSIPPLALQESGVPVTGIDTFDGKTIWVCNPGGHVVSFDNNGAVHALPDGISSFKLAAVNGALVLMPLATTNSLLRTYSLSENHILHNFGEFWEQQDKVGIALIGSLTSNKVTGNVYYAPPYGGFLASYGRDGTRRFTIDTIEAPQIPVVLSSPSGEMRATPLDSTQVESLSISGAMLYVLVNRKDAKPQQMFIDVYKEGTGEYLYSFLTPEPLRSFAVAGHYLYGASSKGVSIWNISE